jgi:LruC domain-containing protein
VIAFTGCSDSDLFDQNVYNSILKAGFPVDSIDSTQNWKTTGSANVSVYVNLDYGEMYTVKVYKSNPLAYSVDTLLASGDVTSGNTLTTTMSYPLTQTLFYVALVDKDGYMQVKPTSLANGTLSAFFGEPSASAKTRDNVPEKSDAYTIPTYSAPSVSQYLTDTEELTSAIALSGSETKIKLSGSWNGAISSLGWGDAVRTIYITGTWTLNNNVAQYINSKNVIVVAKGGSIIIKNNAQLSMGSGAKIYVMSGGSITGEGSLVFYGSGTTGYNYNAGTIDISTISLLGTSFYNVGNMTISSFINNSSGDPFINWGRLVVDGDVNTYNCAFYNGCYVKCTGTINVMDLRVGSSSYLYSMNLQLPYNSLVFLNSNSIVDSENLTAYSSSIYGPTSGDYAIFQFKKLAASIWNPNYMYNYIYLCAESNTWALHAWNLYFKNNSYPILCGYNQINKNMDVSDCSDGYNKDDPTPVTDTPQGYVFCYEDNYPSPGDYDFNDVVLSVYPTTSGNKVTMKVTLDAVGAIKQLAGAIRLAGIKNSDISSITKSGNTKEENTNLNTTFIERSYITDVNNNRLLGRATVGNDVVIPLFNDAHYAISGSMDRYFYNTVEGGHTAEPDTLTYTIVFNNSTTASKLVVDSLDAFLVYSYNSVNWEIHTFPFKSCKVLNDRNEGFSSFYPWAVMVPKPFYYPKEWQPITVKITDSNATDTGAYSVIGNSFAGWAADKSTNTEWYKHPVTSKVYGYPSSTSSVKKKQ